MNAEFKVNDLVTFNAYNEPVPAKVVSAQVGMWGDKEGEDQRIFYKLVGAGKKSLISTCTGKSIEESKLFDSEEFSWT